MNKLTINDLDLRDQRVLVRVDFNVPLNDASSESRSVGDDTRIRAALPTIRTIIEAEGKAILMSHLGRPGGQPDPALSLSCVAERLEELLGKRVRFSSNTTGPAVEDAIASMAPGSVILLENTRFEAGEKANDADLAKDLAALADIYVNDAFGAAHRAHASTEGVAHHVDKTAMGLLMEREVEVLTKVRDAPEQPMAVMLGGAKVSDKMGVIQNLAGHASHILIGGAMSYTFLKALGHDVGASRVEEDRLEHAESLYDEAAGKLMLPSDHVVAEELSAEATPATVEGDIPDGQMGLDIGPETIASYKNILAEARTIIWNGPMGVFEIDQFATGTMAMTEVLADATEEGTYTVVGGGDSVAALAQAGHTDRISHVSTGGGAMLQLLEGKELPGLAALSDT